MAASRKVNDFWVAPILLENMREGMVQVDAWSYSQAMDASNAMGSWQASLQRLGFKSILRLCSGTSPVPEKSHHCGYIMLHLGSEIEYPERCTV